MTYLLQYHMTVILSYDQIIILIAVEITAGIAFFPTMFGDQYIALIS